MITITLYFVGALLGTFYFIGKLATWHAYKISPQNFRNPFTNKDVFVSNIIGFISLALWGFCFYSTLELIQNAAAHQCH
jgi:hypothetical protein